MSIFEEKGLEKNFMVKNQNAIKARINSLIYKIVESDKMGESKTVKQLFSELALEEFVAASCGYKINYNRIDSMRKPTPAKIKKYKEVLGVESVNFVEFTGKSRGKEDLVFFDKFQKEKVKKAEAKSKKKKEESNNKKLFFIISGGANVSRFINNLSERKLILPDDFIYPTKSIGKDINILGNKIPNLEHKGIVDQEGNLFESNLVCVIDGIGNSVMNVSLYPTYRYIYRREAIKVNYLLNQDSLMDKYILNNIFTSDEVDEKIKLYLNSSSPELPELLRKNLDTLSNIAFRIGTLNVLKGLNSPKFEEVERKLKVNI